MVEHDTEITLPDGTVEYYATYKVGGRDEDGEYALVLDGPAEGDKVYL